MALTEAQRQAVQSIYTAITTALQTRYGQGSLFEGVAGIPVDEQGNVTGLPVMVNLEVTDVDGDKVRTRKTVDVW